MVNFTLIFDEYFDEISNTLSFYGKSVIYSDFQLNDNICNEEFSHDDEIEIIISHAKVIHPQTVKVKINKYFNKLKENYLGCVELHLRDKYKHFRQKIHESLFDTDRPNTNQIYKTCNDLRKYIDESIEYQQFEKEEKEIQVVTRYIDRIIKLYEDSDKSNNNMYILQKFQIQQSEELDEYILFLDNHIRSLLVDLNSNKETIKVSSDLYVTNLFDQKQINPFFMFLVYKNINDRTRYRIEKYNEYYLFWNEFTLGLKIFKHIHETKLISANRKLPKIYYNKNITPQLLREIVECREKIGNSLPAIQTAIDNFLKPNYIDINEKTIRNWLERNIFYHVELLAKVRKYMKGLNLPKDQSITARYIVAKLSFEDVELWYSYLSKIDDRFKEQTVG